MKKLVMLFAALAVISCANTPGKPAKTAVERECIDLTEEVKQERATHEKHLDSITTYMDTELKQVQAFMLKETGVLLSFKLHDRNFVNNYEIAIVYVSGYDPTGKHVVDLYFVIATPEGGEEEVLSLLAREPVAVRLEREKLIEETVDDILEFKKRLIEEGLKEDSVENNKHEFEL